MAVSIEKVIHNLHFDRLFLDRIEAVERSQKKHMHSNGIPFHYLCVFKTLLCMNDEAMNITNVSKNYLDIFGRMINQSSLSRTLKYLSDTLGVCDYVSNPHAKQTFTWLKLTKRGKVFQKHLIGSTAIEQEHAPSIRNVINIKGVR